MIWKNLLAFTLALLCSFFAYAAPAQPLSIPEHNALVPSRICLDNATTWEKQGVIPPAQFGAAVAKCVADASAILGRDISASDLREKVKITPERTVGQRIDGFLEGLSLLRIFATIGIVICGIAFVVKTLDLWKDIPTWAYEMVLYGTGLGICLYGLSLSTDNGIWGLMGTLLLVGAQTYTAKARKLEGDPWLFFIIMTMYAALFTFLYQSSLIGYVAVTAFLCAAGFAAHAFGLGYAIGFSDDKSVSQGTAAAFFILGAYVIDRIFHVGNLDMQVFAPGAYLMGSLVGFLGLLIMTSRYYHWDKRGNKLALGGYAFSNIIVMPVACIGAIMIGSEFQIGELQKAGGTCLALWFVEKYVEWTFRGLLSASFFGLIGSLVVFFATTSMKEHIERLGPYLFLVS